MIVNADCRDILATLPDNAYDVILTDPPYGLNICKRGNIGGGTSFRRPTTSKLFRYGRKPIKHTEYTPKQWDKNKPDQSIFDELRRVSKHQIIFGGNYFAQMLPVSSGWIVWDKDNSGNYADVELIWTSYNIPAKKIKYRWNGCLQENMKNKDPRVHPTQKPVGLCEWLLRTLTDPDDTVLDPFAGSGSILLAADAIGRQCYGIELDPEYVAIAINRLNNNQLNLFRG